MAATLAMPSLTPRTPAASHPPWGLGASAIVSTCSVATSMVFNLLSLKKPRRRESGRPDRRLGGLRGLERMPLGGTERMQPQNLSPPIVVPNTTEPPASGATRGPGPRVVGGPDPQADEGPGRGAILRA